jgi:3-oxoacyl-[acyl-carrier protein] reductase
MTHPVTDRSTQPRTAVVTGAARGIGAAIARRLAADGHAVAVADLRAEEAERTAAGIVADGGRAAAVEVDVTDAGSVTAAVARVTDELGAPTILVNDAGILRDNLLFRMSEDDWDAVLGVHLRGAFLMSRAVQAHMVDAGWGRIVNLSSTSALGNRGQVNYSAAKAGIQGFTKTLAIELGKFGVTANAVAPGVIETEMIRAAAERARMPLADYLAAAAKDVPLGRVGQPDDVAAAVAFFCSEQAAYVSGQVLYVAGGPKA